MLPDSFPEPDPSLTPFFKPRGVAVIGASLDPTKLGYGLARNLVQSNYQGMVHFVNPHGGSLFGRPLYANIRQVPDPVDLAVVLIPARFIPQALEECGQRGLRAVIIGSGGFRETGPEGAELENECLRIARSHGIRLLGPNCIGLLDTHLPMDATFLPPPGPLPGDVTFISHSGAICAAVIDWARGQGFGLSHLVSLGNQVDVNETDVLAPLAADPFTRVLTLYLEGVSDGRRFVSEAGRITRQKPIIALKVGRFASGQPSGCLAYRRPCRPGDSFQRRLSQGWSHSGRNQRRGVRLGACPGLVPTSSRAECSRVDQRRWTGRHCRRRH